MRLLSHFEPWSEGSGFRALGLGLELSVEASGLRARILGLQHEFWGYGLWFRVSGLGCRSTYLRGMYSETKAAFVSVCLGFISLGFWPKTLDPKP